jgi:hypothetical protein
MKFPAALVLTIFVALSHSSKAGSFGPGPWSQGYYYPGQLDGKYSAAIFGNNIAGAMGFSLRDGSPTTVEESTVLTNATQNTISIDPFQNYFVCFVEGRTYGGLTIANVNISSKQVTGALLGGQPDFTYLTDTNGSITGVDTLPIVNRGMSGGFQAKIKSNKALFTFKGDGELSTPANEQSVNFSPSPTNATSATITTETTPFQLDGIKVSNDASPSFSQQ